MNDMTAPCAICKCVDTSPREDPGHCRFCRLPASIRASCGSGAGAIDRAQFVETRRFPGISWADCRAEVERENSYRQRTYPDRVSSGRMTQADADYQIAIFAAIAGDIDRMAHVGADRPMATHAYSWNERRQALGREIDMRDRFYPDWIASGRLPQERADRQLLAIRAILWRYDCGFDWRPSNAVLDLTAAELIGGAKRTPQQEETWAEMDAIWRWPDGFFHQRWPSLDVPAPDAEPQLALTE